MPDAIHNNFDSEDPFIYTPEETCTTPLLRGHVWHNIGTEDDPRYVMVPEQAGEVTE